MIIEVTGQLGPCADVRRSPKQGAALEVAVKAHVEVHRLLAYPSEKITQKTVQTMRIATTGQCRPCEARLQVKAKRQAVQWIDRPGKAGSNSVGDKGLDVKLGEDESVGRIGTLQLRVQELESEYPQDLHKGTQDASSDPKGETREAPPDPEEETWDALPDREEATREAPSDGNEETREALSDREEETQKAQLDP